QTGRTGRAGGDAHQRTELLVRDAVLVPDLDGEARGVQGFGDLIGELRGRQIDRRGVDPIAGPGHRTRDGGRHGDLFLVSVDDLDLGDLDLAAVALVFLELVSPEEAALGDGTAGSVDPDPGEPGHDLLRLGGPN